MKTRVPLSGGEPDTPHGPTPTERTLTDGQAADHWVLPETERSGPYARPLRTSYIHVTCGYSTRMSLVIAETYAKQPDYYGRTFCCHCGGYFPVGACGEFVWDGTNEKVGT